MMKIIKKRNLAIGACMLDLIQTDYHVLVTTAKIGAKNEDKH